MQDIMKNVPMSAVTVFSTEQLMFLSIGNHREYDIYFTGSI